MITTTDLIDGIMRREGGFVNDPVDRGGATKYGITHATLANWRGVPVTVEDVRALAEPEARAIYQRQYLEQPGFADLPEPLRTQVVDCGVNAGPATATRLLQRVLGVTEDGIMGPQTKRAALGTNQQRLVLQFWRGRIRFYARLVANQPSQLRFLDGWLNRCWELQPPV